MLIASRTQPRTEAPSRVPLIAATLVVIAALGGYAFYRFVYLPTTPQFAASQYLNAQRTMSELTYMSPEMMAGIGGSASAGPTVFPSYTIGETTINGDDATVKTTTSGGYGGIGASPRAMDLALKRVDGRWKVDAMATARQTFQHMDPAAMAKMNTQMQKVFRSMGGPANGAPSTGGGMGR